MYEEWFSWTHVQKQSGYETKQAAAVANRPVAFVYACCEKTQLLSLRGHDHEIQDDVGVTDLYVAGFDGIGR